MADRKSAAARKKEIDALLRTIRQDYWPYWRTRTPEAYDRHTRTPIHFADKPSDKPSATTIQDPTLRTNSAIIMPENTQTFRGPGAFDDYQKHNARPLRHELIHVLQNIDQHPFSAADDTVRQGLGAGTFYKMRPDYGDDREVSAYALSRTGDLNDQIKKNWKMDDPIFQKQRTWNPFQQPLSPRSSDVEQFRTKYLKALPIGLQGIINSIMGDQ